MHWRYFAYHNFYGSQLTQLSLYLQLNAKMFPQTISKPAIIYIVTLLLLCVNFITIQAYTVLPIYHYNKNNSYIISFIETGHPHSISK